ncbi:DNA circularization N-terminal domain-containing protein [Escherichia coli]|nr:DNA circularization N-terminal domain-containing protein [Escherichia coli]
MPLMLSGIKTGGGGKTTGKGTFRNVPFLVIEEQKQAGGRRLVKREYPLRDTGGVNDLGKKLRSRTFSACILNSNAETARDEAGALMDLMMLRVAVSWYILISALWTSWWIHGNAALKRMN